MSFYLASTGTAQKMNHHLIILFFLVTLFTIIHALPMDNNQHKKQQNVYHVKGRLFIDKVDHEEEPTQKTAKINHVPVTPKNDEKDIISNGYGMFDDPDYW